MFRVTRWKRSRWKATGPERSQTQVKRLLNFETRFQVHALLRQFRVPYRYTEADVEDDLAAHRRLGILPSR
jgi:hypothetical protein